MSEKLRGFEVVERWARKNEDIEIKFPERSTKFSAGYDFFIPKDTILVPNKPQIIWTDIKSYMLPDEFLAIYIRSSLAIKKGIILVNQTGVVDADYSVNNNQNDGNIGICLLNKNKKYVTLNAGEKVAQGIFQKYLLVDQDNTNITRNGGIGSTG